MSLVDVYGFDFDGSTGIRAYKEISTPGDNTTIHFIYLHQSDINSQQYLIYSDSTTTSQSLPYYAIYTYNTSLLMRFYNSANGSIFGLTVRDLIIGESYDVVLKFSGPVDGGMKAFVNGVLNDSIDLTGKIYDDWVFRDDGNIRFGAFFTGLTGFSSQALGNFAIYNRALTDEECINITIGGFDKDSEDIVYLEAFDNGTLGEINTGGTEQYTIIEQKEIPDTEPSYSKLNLCIKPFKYNTDFVQKNKTVSGYNSIAPWKFSSELENRLQDDYVQITTNDIMFINKIKSASNTTQTHKNNFNLHIYSDVVGSLDVYGIYESSNEVIATFDVVTGDNYLTVDLNNVNSLEKLGFILPSIDFRLYLDSDIEIECFETGVQVDVEGINVSVEPSIKSYITLDDSIFTNKIKNPLYSYSSDLILTHAEFEQLADFIDISNLYKRRVMVNIDVNETIGNRTAGIPDISNTDFTFASLQTSETTGLYKYVTISYFNSENNKVR